MPPSQDMSSAGDSSSSSSEKFRPFKWTERTERAALLVAEDRIADIAIAAELKMTDRALRKWKAHPEFAERVRIVTEQLRAAVIKRGVADKTNRLEAMNDVWLGLRQVFRERAEDPKVKDAAGGSTGLVVAEPMLVKVYGVEPGADLEDDDEPMVAQKEARIVYKFAVDTATIKTLLDLQKQTAIETGEWAEKREDGAGDMIIRQYIGIEVQHV